MEQLKSDFMKEKEQFEEQIQSHRESTREARSEKTKSSARVQELETVSSEQKYMREGSSYL